jgi:hypothetical protein
MMMHGTMNVKLHNHFQPALPCCTENEGRDHFVAISEVILLILLVVSPKNFPRHRQTETDHFSIQTAE